MIRISGSSPVIRNTDWFCLVTLLSIRLMCIGCSSSSMNSQITNQFTSLGCGGGYAFFWMGKKTIGE